ncbi:hypothetical protein DUI87_12691 [Hirundo rustica rustica]|uniref:Uncharacterized protein n=1 Tax=Hirundo rustica rustica TaxID=333673 RepID=A0A3M0KFB7_HIRRU|nr:hypothetical protein DUI87_12691 [Hirundo rustica rustica]
MSLVEEKNTSFFSFLPATHKTAAGEVKIFEKDNTLPIWKDLAHHFKIEENSMLEHSAGSSVPEKLRFPRDQPLAPSPWIKARRPCGKALLACGDRDQDWASDLALAGPQEKD